MRGGRAVQLYRSRKASTATSREAEKAAGGNAALASARAELAAAELDILVFADIVSEPMTYFLAHARLAWVQCLFW